MDSDGLTKSITGQTMKVAATIGLLFVPYVNTFLFASGVALGTASIMSTIGKAIGEGVTDKNEKLPAYWDFFNDVDSFTKRFDSGSSEEAKENTWGYENLTNMTQLIVEQLKQQK